MRRIKANYRVLVLALLVWGCGPKDEPVPALPDYLSVPASMDNYAGSGLITVVGEGLSIEARGSESLNTTTKTYQGVTGDITGEDLIATFTLGQPRPYKERQLVPNQYLANGKLSIMRTTTPGTYRMGFDESPGPRGEITDLTLNLTGPQLYVARSGTLTIEKSTLVKTSGRTSLYRVQGTFNVTMYADGVGIPAGQQYPTLTGTFDLLLPRI